MPKTIEPEIIFAALAVDICMFSLENGVLQTLLIPVTSEQKFKGAPALPGGLIHPDETAEQAAKRIMKDTAGLVSQASIWFRQQKLYSRVDRDPRGRVVSLAFVALVPPEVRMDMESRVGARWVDVKSAKKLSYDHDEILADSINHLHDLLQHTTSISYLMPKVFTLTQLQKTYEIILGQELDARNFRKRLQELDVLEEANKIFEGAHRPAMGHRFKKKLPEFVPMLAYGGRK